MHLHPGLWFEFLLIFKILLSLHCSEYVIYVLIGITIAHLNFSSADLSTTHQSKKPDINLRLNKILLCLKRVHAFDLKLNQEYNIWGWAVSDRKEENLPAKAHENLFGL